MTESSTLRKRQAQAQIIKPKYEEMEHALGVEKARRINFNAICMVAKIYWRHLLRPSRD